MVVVLSLDLLNIEIAYGRQNIPTLIRPGGFGNFDGDKRESDTSASVVGRNKRTFAVLSPSPKAGGTIVRMRNGFSSQSSMDGSPAAEALSCDVVPFRS